MTKHNRVVARLANTDSISGLLGLGVASGLLIRLDELIQPQTADGFSSQSLPRLLLWVMLLCGAALLLKGVRREPASTVTVTKDGVRSFAVYAIYALSFVVYALLVPVFGFLPTTLILGFGILANYGERRVFAWVIVAGSIVAIFFFFRSAMFVRLPIGSIFGG